jgi:hypothetical protein
MNGILYFFTIYVGMFVLILANLRKSMLVFQFDSISCKNYVAYCRNKGLALNAFNV